MGVSRFYIKLRVHACRLRCRSWKRGQFDEVRAPQSHAQVRAALSHIKWAELEQKLGAAGVRIVRPGKRTNLNHAHKIV